MANQDDNLVYLGVGVIGAILLGLALAPLRDFTTASNFTFPFMMLTIAMAELGGARATVATALTSALSFDFFLTRPYLRLTIEGKHDIIAFVGLAACGLTAAAFSSRRDRRRAASSAVRRDLDLLHAALVRAEEAGPIEPALGQVLDMARTALPVSALVARDRDDRVVAASGIPPETVAPRQSLRSDLLLADDLDARELTWRSAPLPTDGGRLALTAGNRPVGWLDVWGDASPASVEARRTLSDVGRLVSTLLARQVPPVHGVS
jgi:hypothetical protein